MPIGQMPMRTTPSTEVTAGTAFALLVALAAASRAPRRELPADMASALDAVDDTEGESWLNMLGVALDAGAPYTAERLVDEIATLDAVELRRHLLGRYAWSWCTLGGVDDIEAAAAGDRAAATRLLAKPRYYGGDAARSLGRLLELEPAESRRRILTAVETGRTTLLAPETTELLGVAERSAAETLATEAAADAIEMLASGYRYVPELEAERVVLLPHLEPSLPLVLAQHRSARLIAYCVRPERGDEERLVELGRALADPKRIEILALVGRGIGGSAQLVAATGLSRSTVHHHLSLLRGAGLVALEGNARAYTYVMRPEAAVEVATLVAGVTGTEE
jgi:DNA-binding transcriptional ArsR family regulator